MSWKPAVSAGRIHASTVSVPAICSGAGLPRSTPSFAPSKCSAVFDAGAADAVAGDAAGVSEPLDATSATTTPTTTTTRAATAMIHHGRFFGTGTAGRASDSDTRPLRTEFSSGASSAEYTRPWNEYEPGGALGLIAMRTGYDTEPPGGTLRCGSTTVNHC